MGEVCSLGPHVASFGSACCCEPLLSWLWGHWKSGHSSEIRKSFILKCHLKILLDVNLNVRLNNFRIILVIFKDTTIDKLNLPRYHSFLLLIFWLPWKILLTSHTTHRYYWHCLFVRNHLHLKLIDSEKEIDILFGLLLYHQENHLTWKTSPLKVTIPSAIFKMSSLNVSSNIMRPFMAPI